MVDIVRIAGFCLVTVMLLSIVREQRPEIARQLSLVAGMIVFALVLWRLGYVLEVINDLAYKVGFAPGQIAAVIKAVGIAYVTEFASAACRDAGESALASKLELAGKIAILIIAVPIILSVFDLVHRLLT